VLHGQSTGAGMKAGDLVKFRPRSMDKAFESIRPIKRKILLVVEIMSEHSCRVIFPDSGKIHPCLISCLEVISESV
jgi:hypothetical protein